MKYIVINFIKNISFLILALVLFWVASLDNGKHTIE